MSDQRDVPVERGVSMRPASRAIALSAIVMTLYATRVDASPTGFAPVPRWFGRIIETHVRSMERVDQYHEITQGITESGGYLDALDLFHAHLLTGPRAQYATVADFLHGVRGILYHTEETTRRWDGQAPMSPIWRVQRSVLGLRDGRTIAAIDAVGINRLSDPKNYVQRGTVFSDDIISRFPRWRDGEIGIRTRIGEGPTACEPEHQILLRPDSQGRFSSRMQRFEVLLRCSPLEKEQPFKRAKSSAP